jgi:predicted AlkP superfamily phosphohydrolase/phosphomutase
VTSSPIRGKTFLDALAGNGLSVGAVCVPVTYPPWDVGGIMISGYPCPEGRWFVWPQQTEIKTPPTPHVATVVGTDPGRPLEDAKVAMWKRRNLVDEILSGRELDCLLVVFPAIDHVQHVYGWQGTRAAIREIYKEADLLLEKMMSSAGPETLLVVVSDHGGAPPPRWVFRTKRWLCETGLAAPLHPRASGSSAHPPASRGSRPADTSKRGAPEWVLKDERFLRAIAEKAARESRKAAGFPVHLDLRGVDPKRSRVLRFGMCDLSEGLVINLAGRQRDGIVPDAEYEGVKDALVEAAEQLVTRTEPTRVLESVKRREEVFPGSSPEAALPDVVLLFKDGVRAVGDTEGPVVSRIESESPPASQVASLSTRGVHSIDGIWGMMGPGVRPGGGFIASICDVAPTVLSYFNTPTPWPTDGRPRRDLLHRPGAVDG